MADVGTTLRSLYIAGPMRGIENYNFPLFKKVAKKLRKNGWFVVSPAEMDEALGLDQTHELRAFSEYMQRDLSAVCDCDGIVLLPGWETSKGARLEAMVAVEVDKHIFVWEDESLRTIPSSMVGRVFAGYGEENGADIFKRFDEAAEAVTVEEKPTISFLGIMDKALPIHSRGEPIEWLEDESYPHQRHPGSERFHQILGELGALHDKKQSDYGTDADPFANVRGAEDFGLKGWVGAAVRMNDKMRRIQKAARSGTLSNESLEDSFRDLAVYSVIALVLLEEENDG